MSNKKSVSRYSPRSGTRAGIGGKGKATEGGDWIGGAELASLRGAVVGGIVSGANDLVRVGQLLSEEIAAAVQQRNYSLAGTLADDRAKVVTALRQILKILPPAPAQEERGGEEDPARLLEGAG